MVESRRSEAADIGSSTLDLRRRPDPIITTPLWPRGLLEWLSDATERLLKAIRGKSDSSRVRSVRYIGMCAREPRKNIMLDLLFVVVICGAWLGITACFLHPDRIHISAMGGAMNDQAGYISAGRHLADTGRIDVGAIIPSLLNQTDRTGYIYMPGHYYALAASYALFNSATLGSLLPSVLGFLISAVCVFLVSARLAGRRLAWISLVLFLVFPANTVYAYSAMSEMTLVAAVCMALCVVVYAPPAYRPWVAAAALALPFVFRETTCFVVVTMFALAASRRYGGRIRNGILLGGLSVAVISLIFFSEMSRSRGSVLNAHLMDGSFQSIYRDAYGPNSSDLGAGVMLQAVVGNFGDSASALLDSLATHPATFANGSLLIIFAALSAIAVHAVFRRPYDHMAMGIVGTAAATIVFLCAFYQVGLRGVLFLWPLCAIGLAPILASGVTRLHALADVSSVRASCAGLGAAAAAVALLVVYRVGHQYPIADRIDDENTRFLESLGHDDETVLVAPWQLSVDYMLRHHPVRWSFLPGNAKTLALLAKQWTVGTIVIPDDYEAINARDCEAIGMEYISLVAHRGRSYRVFRAPQRTAATFPQQSVEATVERSLP